MERNNQKGNVVSKVMRLANEIAKQQDVKVWDVRFLKEGSNWILRIFIDKEKGVGIEDCERFSRAIDKPLDELDPITQAYSLEVCSPGLERELVRDEHFLEYIGSNVLVRTIRPTQDKLRDFKGILKSYNDGVIELQDIDGKILTFNKKDTSFIKLDDFDL